MRILLDTNIIIALEDNKRIDDNFSAFLRDANSNLCKIYYHPACIKDIHRDKNPERRDIILSKIRKYEKLPNPSGLTKEFAEKVGQKNDNDQIDNQQLFQLHCGYVELFVTEDSALLKKAKRIGLKEKALTLQEALKKLKKHFEYTAPKHPVLKVGSVREIKERIDEPFFESLKADYGDFNAWFEKCLRQDRQCYYLLSENKLSALLIYNEENPEQHQIAGIYEKALKMCTFKTAGDAFGKNMGELFLNKMFQYCIEKGIHILYLTLFEKFGYLVGLLKKFGFHKITSSDKGEVIMLKHLDKKKAVPCTGRRHQRAQHPLYSDSQDVQKFVIPILPEFYNKLFKDGKLRQPKLFDKQKSSLNEIEGNSIIKAYISTPRRKSFNPGDILLFYASQELKSIEPVGILESFDLIDDLEKLKSRVRGKTVFSEKKLEQIFEGYGGNVQVIIFRLVYYLKKPILLEDLRKLRVKCISANLITITQLEENDYLQLKQEGFFDERYIID